MLRQLVDHEHFRIDAGPRGPAQSEFRLSPTGMPEEVVSNGRSIMDFPFMVDQWSPDHRQRREKFGQILDGLSCALLHVMVSG